MRFLSMIRVDEHTGQVPSEQLMQDMGTLIDEMQEKARWCARPGFGRRRKAGASGCTRGSSRPSTGRFGTKEVIGGFAILEAPSIQAAVELTERFLRVHGDAWEIECEVRQLDGPEFGCNPTVDSGTLGDMAEHVIAGLNTPRARALNVWVSRLPPAVRRPCPPRPRTGSAGRRRHLPGS